MIKKDKYLSILEDWHMSFINNDTSSIECINNNLEKDRDVLFLYHNRKPVINNINKNQYGFVEKKGVHKIHSINEYINPGILLCKRFFYTDYITLDFVKLKLYLSIKDKVAENAKINLLVETIIIALLFSSSKVKSIGYYNLNIIK